MPRECAGCKALEREIDNAEYIKQKALEFGGRMEEERDQLRAENQRLRDTIVNAVVPLAVLAGQSAAEPYRELSADMQRRIVVAVNGIRQVLGIEEKISK